MKKFFAALLAVIVLLSALFFLIGQNFVGENKRVTDASEVDSKPFYLGVTFCGNTTAEAQSLIDRVKSYTNLFVLLSGPVSKNETAITEICDYAVASNLRIIILFGWFDPAHPWQIPYLDFAKHRWGDNFLVVYYYDEPGGQQLDYNWSGTFTRIKTRNSLVYQIHQPAIEDYLNGTSSLRNYDTAAEIYSNMIKNDSGIRELKKHSITTFTSEYALYWYSYKGGFDVLLAQFGWNDTTTQTIDLTRGAARMQNKSWGAIITWKYDKPPYLDSGEKIYDQMLMAYDSGAQYVTVFNYANDSDGTHAIMQDEHFAALEKLWKHLMEKPKPSKNSDKVDTALVLPRNYGWGMRRLNDRIWYWEADEKSPQIWAISRNLLQKFGTAIDIIYDDPDFPYCSEYTHIYYWNSTT
jgi:hypothetical protein